VRDLLVLAIVLLMLPSSFKRPFVGLLLFSWLAYMRPQDLCWGFVRPMRLSFFVGIVMVVGWWANEQGRRAFARWDFRSMAILVLAILATISYLLAQTWDQYTNRFFAEFLKIVVVALFTSGQVDTKQRLRTLLWLIAISLGFFGVKGGILGILSGGAAIKRGPGGMLEDNNDYALGLVMNIPLLWYLGASERRSPWVKPYTQVAVALTIITVALTHSRGGFLAMVATGLWIAWRSGKLVRALLLLAGLGVVFLLCVPHEVLERLGSITDTGESSIQARFRSWTVALAMIRAHPLLGVGPRNFVYRFEEFSDAPLFVGEQTHVAHNSYLQIWAEGGTFAFLCYLMLLGSIFVVCRKVYRVARVRPELRWAANYSRMFEATTIGFLVGSVFLNRGHFDLIYHWIAMVTALGAIVAAELRSSAAESISQPISQSSQPARASPSAAPAPGRPAIEIGWRKPGGGRRMWVPASQTAAGGSPMSTSWRRPGWWR
jgi:probable O-glycosylation ligase (exosortase A-associated)